MSNTKSDQVEKLWKFIMNTKEPLTKQWKDQLTADTVQPTKY